MNQPNSEGLFELAFTESKAWPLHVRNVGDLESRYPWESLDATDWSPALVAWARQIWTARAYNEYCSIGLTAQLLQALTQAGAPLDLVSLASTFPLEELRHAELCGRVAATLGGGTPLRHDPRRMEFARDPSLTSAQEANGLAMQCCVSETLSFHLLGMEARQTTTPLLKEVLRCLYREEALHAQFGWLYLAWAAPALDECERQRLAAIARTTAAACATTWREPPDYAAMGLEDAALSRAGIIPPTLLAPVGERLIAQRLREPLAELGFVL